MFKQWDRPVTFDGTPLWRQGLPGLVELLARCVVFTGYLLILVALLIACGMPWWVAVAVALAFAAGLVWAGRRSTR